MSGTIGTNGVIPMILAGQDSHFAAPTSQVVQPLFEAPPTTQPSIYAIPFSFKNS
jgi:hypothetical protein